MKLEIDGNARPVEDTSHDRLSVLRDAHRTLIALADGADSGWGAQTAAARTVDELARCFRAGTLPDDPADWVMILEAIDHVIFSDPEAGETSALVMLVQRGVVVGASVGNSLAYIVPPTGDPLVDGVGPAAWAIRPDFPDLTFEGEPKIVPMRIATEFKVAHQDPDPRGKDVLGLDNEVAATVTDIWVDRSEPQVRYLEIEVKENGKRAMIPITLSRVRGDGTVKVHCLRAAQFANMPTLANQDQITLQEEDRVCAYVGGGTLYGTRERTEPLL